MAHKAEGSGILESGNIYFLYRPKVQHEQARKKDDVERFYMVLSPEGKKIYREIIIGQKELPDIEKQERNWGFVKMVVKDAKELEGEFAEVEYSTKTKGERKLAAARPAGEGVYAIVRHDGHTHLAYSLELPEKPRQVQQEFRIKDEASYIISIKNPKKGSPPKAGLRGEQKAEYPEKLQEVFRDRNFADADPPELLDFEGAEIMLIGAREDPEKELDVKMGAEHETEASADIFRDLKLNRQKHPLKQLFEGKELV
jgi:hypothetical protein